MDAIADGLERKQVEAFKSDAQQLPDLTREAGDDLGVAKGNLRHKRHELAKLLGILGRLELEDLNVRLVMPELLRQFRRGRRRVDRFLLSTWEMFSPRDCTGNAQALQVQQEREGGREGRHTGGGGRGGGVEQQGRKCIVRAMGLRRGGLEGRGQGGRDHLHELGPVRFRVAFDEVLELEQRCGTL